MTTPDGASATKAQQLLKEKLSMMSIEEFTHDHGLLMAFRKYEQMTVGTVEDFVNLADKSVLPNWSETMERRLERAVARLHARVDAHLSAPTKAQLNSALPPFDEQLADRLRKIGMDAISSDVRMNNCYVKSGALSLYAFAYKMDRVALRNWGNKSELLFQDELKRYAATSPANGSQVAEEAMTTGLDQAMSSFTSLDDDKLRRFYISNFRPIHESIRKQAREEMLMSQIAAEMNLKWPYRYRTRLLKEFLFDDKGRLFKTSGLGKKKIRVIILCLIWAAKGGQRDMDKFREMSPGEILEASPLSANEKKALTLRFLGKEPITLEEAGRIMNVTRERVRQHQKTAEAKLRGLGINHYARDWLRRNSSKIWAMLSDDDGETVEPSKLKRFVPGEVLLATVMSGWSLDDVLSLEGDPVDNWWVRKTKA